MTELPELTPILANNFSGEKVALPADHLQDFKSFIVAQSKNPWFVRSYAMEQYLEYDAPIVNAEINGIIASTPSMLNKWCTFTEDTVPRYHTVPNTQLDNVYSLLMSNNPLFVAKNFDDFKTAEGYAVQIRTTNQVPTLLIYSDFKLTRFREGSGRLYIIGHQHEDTVYYTVAQTIERRPTTGELSIPTQNTVPSVFSTVVDGSRSTVVDGSRSTVIGEQVTVSASEEKVAFDESGSPVNFNEDEIIGDFGRSGSSEFGRSGSSDFGREDSSDFGSGKSRA